MALHKRYTEEEDENYIKEPFNNDISAGELQEIIENLYDNTPDKRTKNYKTWKGKINKFIKFYNEKFGKVYKNVI